MKQKTNDLIRWIKSHKHELILAGISVTALVGLVLTIKHRRDIEKLWHELSLIVPENAPAAEAKIIAARSSALLPEECSLAQLQRTPHDVSAHIRNLPKGHTASVQKVAEAAELGIILMPGQTLVDQYRTGGLVA